MKHLKINLAIILVASMLNCKKDNDEIIFCGSRCPGSTPWKVESLDLGTPCFATREQCQSWANSAGYSGKPCVKCD